MLNVKKDDAITKHMRALCWNRGENMIGSQHEKSLWHVSLPADRKGEE